MKAAQRQKRLLEILTYSENYMTVQSLADTFTVSKYSLQGTTQSRYLTGGVPPVRFSM